jgi:hypothetical protein
MDLITRFQELVAQMPEILQPLIVALAGAVPFIEGEGAATIGIVGGLHPAVAITAGAIGNFLCVFVLVTTSSKARSVVVSRRRRAAESRRGPHRRRSRTGRGRTGRRVRRSRRERQEVRPQGQVPERARPLRRARREPARPPSTTHPVHRHHARQLRCEQGAGAVLAGTRHRRMVHPDRRCRRRRHASRRLKWQNSTTGRTSNQGLQRESPAGGRSSIGQTKSCDLAVTDSER